MLLGLLAVADNRVVVMWSDGRVVMDADGVDGGQVPLMRARAIPVGGTGRVEVAVPRLINGFCYVVLQGLGLRWNDMRRLMSLTWLMSSLNMSMITPCCSTITTCCDSTALVAAFASRPSALACCVSALRDSNCSTLIFIALL